MSAKQLRPAQFLFREGEISKSLFLIQKGSLSIRKSKGGEFVEIGRVYSNEIIGEISFFDRAPRSASAVALTEVEVMEITFEALDKVYDNVPPYLKTIMAGMAERLRRADDIIKKLQTETVKGSVEAANPTATEAPTAADVMAATASIDLDSLGGDKRKKD